MIFFWDCLKDIVNKRSNIRNKYIISQSSLIFAIKNNMNLVYLISTN